MQSIIIFSVCVLSSFTICFIVCLLWPQRTKELMSDGPGLAGFAVGLVDFTLSLPDRQVKVLAPWVLKSPRTGEWLIEFTFLV